MKKIAFYLTLLTISSDTWALVYYVKKDDTVSVIAKQFYSGNIWGQNGGVEKVLSQNPQIKNEDLIYPGEMLQISPEINSSQTKADDKEVIPTLPGTVETSPPVEAVSDKTEIARKVSNTSADEFDMKTSAIVLSPFFGVASIESQDLSSGTKDSIASNIYAGINAQYTQVWSDQFDTDIHVGLADMSFSPPTNGVQTLAVSSKFLSSFGLGATHALPSNFNFGLSLDLAQNIFIRAASSTSVTADSILIPSIGAKISYHILQLKSFFLNLSVFYHEEFKSTTDSYGIGFGSLYGTGLEVGKAKNGVDSFSVLFSADSRAQDTTLTSQNETRYMMSLKIFFPESNSNHMSETK